MVILPYVYSTEWNYTTGANTISYAMVNTRTKQILSRNFISDGSETKIRIPYGITVNPETREIYVTDAGKLCNTWQDLLLFS